MREERDEAPPVFNVIVGESPLNRWRFSEEASKRSNSTEGIRKQQDRKTTKRGTR